MVVQWDAGRGTQDKYADMEIISLNEGHIGYFSGPGGCDQGVQAKISLAELVHEITHLRSLWAVRIDET